MSDGSVVIRNARVFDGRSLLPGADTVAVAKGRISAVGMWSEVRSQITASAEDVDAGGALILPSFTDAHVHPAQAGLELLDCDLSGARSQGEVLDLVRDYASKHPDQPWILGAGWQTVQFGRGGPRASQLDEIAPGRPIVLTDAGHHATWMSSTALQLLGITASTPDPVDGRIDRDANGQPSGVVHEGAMEIGREIIPVPSPDRIADGLLEAQRTLFSVGVTGWQDAIVGDYAGSLDSTAGYHTAYQRGTFQARTTAALWLDRSASERNPRDVAEELLARRRHFESLETAGQLTAPAVKVMLDGVVEARTAAMKAPYTDAPSFPGHFDTERLGSIAIELVRVGFQLHFHAIGDAALEQALDLVEATASVAERRHHVAHLQIVDPADIPRMARLGVTANLQMLWACNDEQNLAVCRPALGEDRYLAQQFLFNSFHRAGVPLAAGSDWPVTTPNPWQAIAVGVTRVLPGSSAEPLAPSEALPLHVALSAYTRGSALTVGDTEGGRIGVGARADLVQLDRDPFELPPSELHTVKTIGTWASGRRVFGR